MSDRSGKPIGREGAVATRAQAVGNSATASAATLPSPITDRLFRGIVGTAPTIIWMDDTEGRCIFINKTWCEFTGRPESDGLGEG
jgi:PAS domain-containing protein